jgi:hypothetical protein
VFLLVHEIGFLGRCYYLSLGDGSLLLFLLGLNGRLPVRPSLSGINGALDVLGEIVERPPRAEQILDLTLPVVGTQHPQLEDLLEHLDAVIHKRLTIILLLEKQVVTHLEGHLLKVRDGLLHPLRDVVNLQWGNNRYTGFLGQHLVVKDLVPLLKQ